MNDAEAKTQTPPGGANAATPATPPSTASGGETAAGPDGGSAAAAQEPVLPLSPGTLTEQQLEELKQRAAKADEYWDKLLRTAADFDNFRKRVLRERQETVQLANAALLQKLLPVLDTFEMALAACPDAAGADHQPRDENLAALRSGVRLIQQQLRNVLAEAGLQEIDATGQPFDPRWHEAVAEEETSQVPEGRVVRQVRKGYRLHERLLRPAAVVVAKKPAHPSANPPPQTGQGIP